MYERTQQAKPCTAVKGRGFTLIELLLVVAIIGILTMLAVPSYRHVMQQGVRGVATAALLDLGVRQEQFFLNNLSYSNDLAALGYPPARVFTRGGGSAVALDDSRAAVAQNSATRVYIISIDQADATGFSLSAVPQLGQAEDTGCGTLGLDANGTRSASGTGNVADCW